MKCLEDVGMLRTDPIMVDGKEIVPIQVLKELLPDPASLGPRTVGKTNIGCIFTGVKDGKEKSIYIYNVCDHQECYKEVESQAISYTTGVPAMIGAMMVVKGLWKKVSKENFPDCLEITAEDVEEGQIMALRHREYDVRGIQFHPESILTPKGKTIIWNWIADSNGQLIINN